MRGVNAGHVNPIVAKDGRLFQIEWFAQGLTNDEGRFRGLLNIGHDVTQRIEHEQALGDAGLTYAVAGNYSGFRILDVSEPGDPEVVSDFPCHGPQGDVSVTIYNTGQALVQDVRQLNIASGRTRIEFPDVSAQMSAISAKSASLRAVQSLVSTWIDIRLPAPGSLVVRTPLVQ